MRNEDELILRVRNPDLDDEFRNRIKRLDEKGTFKKLASDRRLTLENLEKISELNICDHFVREDQEPEPGDYIIHPDGYGEFFEG
ncbi:MAG: hypothetical protein GWN01_16680 [Nitrosopumilaceae archaeon]|nr:hypothetical protein [Nitrosopumilaceae archaeon]NIU02469.1 hypothetical protein [Nitrosopumilaceae archaeon]NIU88930.1 hypothetical protein [Nitrosopumilaceae archaeon]NIV67041.1 hypothetical protein [Nitrosopumilaceae archaeon]NIX63070.1 hypothetical protein [Nitrosopumilaceae archaeon]